VNWPLVQISVVVATIQTSYLMYFVKKHTNYVNIALKAVVGKGSLRVALMQGLVGPKGSVRTSILDFLRKPRKGSELIFLHLYLDGYN
jgi:hypothetical protein